MFSISPLNQSILPEITDRINQKTKPPGSLGKLEVLATQLALITTTSSNQPIQINQPTMLIFAGDHGIAEEGVSIAPSEVTQQMVANFVAGGAAINCFTRVNAMDLKIIDCGILNAVDDASVINHRLGDRTNNFSSAMAMNIEDVERGFKFSQSLINQLFEQGVNTIGIGEMGIANTSSAAALMAACLQIDPSLCVGKGTGVDNDVIIKKRELIEKAIVLHGAHLNDPMRTLAAVGGFEIVQMTAAILAAAEKNMVIIIDGFISTAAAMMAHWIEPSAKDYMVFAHCSEEQGHQRMLQHLEGDALLNLDMRLGEGTGAALALNLLRAAAAFYNDMASFETAGIESV